MFLFCLVFAMFCARLFVCALWSPAGKGLTSWLSFVVSSVSLSLSRWCPGSGVVLDCIDSWSLQPYYSSWRCRGLFCSMWMWYFLIILAYFFNIKQMTNETFKRLVNWYDLDQRVNYYQCDQILFRERSGSVVECLTRDRRAAGSSLTGVTALWSLSKTHLS